VKVNNRAAKISAAVEKNLRVYISNYLSEVLQNQMALAFIVAADASN
jgi:hypothetical protein